MMETGYSLADIAAATGNSGGGNNNDGFGGNNGWWIILLFLALANGGFGNNNGGGFGGGGGSQGYSQPIVIDAGRSGGSCGCGCSPCATQADLAAGFNNSAVLSGINGIDSTLCQGFSGINLAINQTARGIDNAICNLGYNIQGGFNGVERSFCNLGYQVKDCCCETQRLIERGFADTNYNLANQSCETRHAIYNSTRDIIDNANANSRAILDFLTKDKIDTLQSENLALRFAASQTDQNAVLRAAIDASTAEIIRRTGNDCPVPAYVVNGPTPINFPTNCCGTVQFGNGCNSGCGGY